MSETSYSNALAKETSPYLLQHAHNPVNWFPWNKETLEKAKKENKLLIISIGYSACHWCHVMEHESFEDKEVAEKMNAGYISIKVDREERPDIDVIYMHAAQLITGQGGWPLNAIALPDGKPIYAGTYYPKSNWLKVLEYFQKIWHEEPEKLEHQAKLITKEVKTAEEITLNPNPPSFDYSQLKNIFDRLKTQVDLTEGGKSGAPKFPMPNNFEFLLHYHHLSNDELSMEAIRVTLEKMALGGIYDQIGGGFSRYSVDPVWLVPHFEKMLYDNAQLVGLYAKAYRAEKKPLYKEVVYETLDFVEREFTANNHGFYSALDADSEGEEGKYYVWTKKEVADILGNDAELIIKYFNITAEGNWEEGKNIPHRKISDEAFAEKEGIPVDTLKKKVAKAKKQLRIKRSDRIMPGLDDKILTAWNALMLTGYVEAYRTFREDKFLKAAEKNAGFLLKHMITDEQVFRNHKNGKTTINGFLDDYSFTAEAFIALYEATFDPKWLEEAEKIIDMAILNFFDSKSGLFYYTSSNDDPLIARKKELSDNVIPCSNSSMCKALFRLGKIMDREDLIRMSERMVNNLMPLIPHQPWFYSNWGIALAWFVKPPFEVAIVGEDFEKMQTLFDLHHLPFAIFLGGKDENNIPLLKGKKVKNETYIYICLEKTCQSPVKIVDLALDQVNKT